MLKTAYEHVMSSFDIVSEIVFQVLISIYKLK